MSIEIDNISDDAVKLTLNGWIYSIDDSTGEKIVERWPANDDENSDMERDKYICEWVEYGGNVPEPVYEGTGILDLKVTGFKEASV